MKQVIVLASVLFIAISAMTVALPAMAAAADPVSTAASFDWTDLLSFLLAAMGIAGLLIIRRQASHL